MLKRELLTLMRAALPDINRARRAFGAKPVRALNLRCANIVGSCPVATALAPTKLTSVYSGVLTGERWTGKDDYDAEGDFINDIPRLKKMAKVWRVRVRRARFLDFCCHRHFGETAPVVSLPPALKQFVGAFIDWTNERAERD